MINQKYTMTRRLEFDAGHRLTRHESKCRNAHGHRYVVEVTLSSGSLDNCGRIMDFSVVKDRLGGWIDQEWDHGMILMQDDVDLIETLTKIGNKVFVIDVEPTAENLARVLFLKARELLESTGEGLTVERVKLAETPNCWAEWDRSAERRAE